jgi:hypothetical protein
MSLTIYKYASPNVPRATIEPSEDSNQQIELMGTDVLNITFSVPVPIPFQIGDYCLFIDKLYQINKFPKRTVTDERNITYNLVMESEMFDLGKTEFLFMDADNNFTGPLYPAFRGKPRDFGDLIVLNLKRMYPAADWKLGSVIDADFATQSFTSPQNCLEVLKTVATLFNTEYVIEGKTINIYQRQTSSGVTLRQGQDEGLVSLTDEDQTNASVITRLYVLGSTKNITNTYRNGASNLQIGSIPYIEKNIAQYRQFEDTIIFDGTTTDPKSGAPLPEIYPHRTGTITSIDDFLHFYDSGIDFNLNDYLISGVTAQLVFNTGLLAGYTFDISAFDNATKKISINQNTNEPSLIVPTASLTPVIGDQYVFINITMPQTYVDAAESALLAAGQNYLDGNGIPPRTYSGSPNAKYFRQNNINLEIGQSIAVQSDLLALDVITRITAYTRNLRNPYIYTMTLANTVKPNSIIVQLINGL